MHLDGSFPAVWGYDGSQMIFHRDTGVIDGSLGVVVGSPLAAWAVLDESNWGHIG